MLGLFIQRHAEAAGRYCRVGVVYTHVVDGEGGIKGFDVDFKQENGIPTARVYYSNPEANIPLLTEFVRACCFFRANRKGIRMIKKELGGFDLVHVHILTRLGIIALWTKWTEGKPFMITEHWSRYLNLTGGFKGWLRKRITRLVVKNAAIVTTVTQNLAEAMQIHGLKNANYRLLPNVVSDDFLNFQKEQKGASKTTFVHVSCFEDKSKNISGLLRMIRSLSDKRKDFIFKLVGEGMDSHSLKQYAKELGLTEETVIFTGLLEGKPLVREMASADLMVVFSNYENFPVVINESFALGVPVIATRVGGIPEFVNEQNGFLIAPGDEKALEETLSGYLDGKIMFDSNRISNEFREAFSPENTGKQLLTMYEEIIH